MRMIKVMIMLMMYMVMTMIMRMMAPGWAKRRRGRLRSANLVVVAIKKVMMMRKVTEIFIFKGVVVIVLLAGTIRKGKKDLFGRTRSNPVFCSVTPSIGGTWDLIV